MPPKKKVVAAALKRGDRFLLGKRALHKLAAPGFWCPISGNVEAGESLEAAVVRECSEEVGLRVEVKRKVAVCDTRDGSAEIHWFLVWDALELRFAPPEASLANDEHTALGWFTAEEMRRLAPLVFAEDLDIFRLL